MGERTWSYTTPNPHRSPVPIEVGGDAEVLAEMGTEALIQALADRGVLVKVGWCPRGDGHLDGPDPEYPSDSWGECGSKWIAEAWMTRWEAE